MSVPGKVKLMGILNYTPDSFSDGGKFNSLNAAYEHIKQMINDGADIIDVGACSTRPGSVPVSQEEELNRLREIIPFIKKEFNVPVSADTFYPENMIYSNECGVDIINDVSGVYTRKKAGIIKNSGCKWVIMHGGVLSEEKECHYPLGIVNSVQLFFDEILDKAEQDGIKDRIILDPGFGFPKSTDENRVLLNNLKLLDTDGVPLLTGLSRKRFIGELSSDPDCSNRLGGTLAANILCVLGGADIVRTHEIPIHRKALDLLYNLDN